MASVIPQNGQMIVTHGTAYSLYTQTQLNLDSVQAAFNQGKSLYNSKNYTQAIASYTDALKIIQTELTSTILLHRAAAHEMQHNYCLALQDSQDANPNNDNMAPDAYYASGTALLLQNQLKEAAQIFHQGITKVPERTRDHEILVDYHEKIQAKISLDNQGMVQRLPLEVIMRILSYLSIDDCTQLSASCRFWHEFIVNQLPAIWTHVDITGKISRSYALPKWYSDYLDAKGINGVKSIILDIPQIEDTVSHQVFKRIAQKKWTKVESLEIIFPNKFELRQEKATFRKIVQSNKNSIKSLTMHTGGNYTDTLKNIFKTLPNLQTVTNHVALGRTGKMGKIVSDLSESNMHLTAFTFTFGPSIESCGEVIFKPNPHLASITIDCKSLFSFHHASILHTIHKCCSDALQTFSFKPVDFGSLNRMSICLPVGFSATYSRILPQQQQEDNRNNERKGLETLEFLAKRLPNDTEEMDPKIDEMMARITQKNHSTLKNIIIELDSFALTDVKSLQVLVELGAPNLTKLVLRQNNHLCRLNPVVLAGLIKASPSLHTIELSGTNFWDDSVLEAIGDLLNLRQFSMYLDNHGMTMEPTPPKDYQGVVSTEAMQNFLARAKKLRYFEFGAAERQGESFYVINKTLTHAQKRNGEVPHINAKYPRHLPHDLPLSVAQTVATSPNIKEFHTIT